MGRLFFAQSLILIIELICVFWVSCFIFFFITLSSTAQELSDVFNIQFYGVEKGLSHRNTQTITQDQEGIIWIGTEYGLNRFDGYHFKWFTKEKHELASNNVQVLLKDQEGLLWLIDTEGKRKEKIKALTLFEPLLQKSIPIQEKFKEGLPFELEDVMLYAESEDNTLTFITNKNKIYSYSNEWTSIFFPTNKFETFSEFHQIAENEYWLIGQPSVGKHNVIIINEKGSNH